MTSTAWPICWPTPPSPTSTGTLPCAGEQAIRQLFASTARLYPDGTPWTKHVTTNLILEIDEAADHATARSYWTVFQAVEGLPLQPILAGRYLDTFERHDGHWRFVRAAVRHRPGR